MDIHAHVITPACLELVKGLMEPEYEPFSYWAGKETNEYQAGHMQEIIPKATDPAVRIADMDAMGIDVQAISVAPPQYYYWTDVELGRKLARMQNENLASMVEDNPDRCGAGHRAVRDVCRRWRSWSTASRARLPRRGVNTTSSGGLDAAASARSSPRPRSSTSRMSHELLHARRAAAEVLQTNVSGILWTPRSRSTGYPSAACSRTTRR